MRSTVPACSGSPSVTLLAVLERHVVTRFQTTSALPSIACFSLGIALHRSFGLLHQNATERILHRVEQLQGLGMCLEGVLAVSAVLRDLTFAIAGIEE